MARTKQSARKTTGGKAPRKGNVSKAPKEAEKPKRRFKPGTGTY